MEYMSTEIRSAREAMTIFKILGIKEITTTRQRKNGTQVFELPIQQMYQNLVPKPLRFATYKTGYVRNVSPYNSSSYQINKTKKRPAGTNGYHFEHVERILIQGWENRLIYLARFIIKNYYKKPTYLMNDYVIECLKEAYLEQNKTGLPFDEDDKFFCSTDDVQVIVNGHRYNLS
tara:strand:+ start:424 stop:948 length:525 start_codon:yes stop_codon:yes gene_type:complete